jgi:hypothetical protein
VRADGALPHPVDVPNGKTAAAVFLYAKQPHQCLSGEDSCISFPVCKQSSCKQDSCSSGFVG